MCPLPLLIQAKSLAVQIRRQSLRGIVGPSRGLEPRLPLPLSGTLSLTPHPPLRRKCLRFPQIGNLATFQSSTARRSGCQFPPPDPTSALYSGQVWAPQRSLEFEEQRWTWLPSRDTHTGSVPSPRESGSSVTHRPLRKCARAALLPPTALASPPGVRFPWPSEPLGLGPGPMLLLSEEWFGENRC